MTNKQRCGFVSVVGIPNAGKSTIINNIVGSKVSIVSHKVQTTRCRVLGMAIHNNTQIILMDTPGIFKAKKTLEKAMVTSALSSFNDTDFVIHMVDAAMNNPVEKNKMILNSLQEQGENQNNIILVLNKIDKISRQGLLKTAQEMNDAFPYKATFMVSAIDGKGVGDLADYLSEILPQEPWIYPEDQISNMPMRLMAAEITREKVFNHLHEEIPYSIFVETENWEEFDNGSIKISQVIYVQKNSQKGVVLGKGGQKIKSIGQASRLELEEIMGQKVHLKIFVKVQENWAERTENYEIFGLDSPI